MESIVILATAVVTVFWSVRGYFIITEQLKRRIREDSPLRLALIVSPSAYFLALIFVGWQRAGGIRLDLIGLVVFDALAILSLLASYIIGATKRPSTAWVVLLSLYQLVSLAIIAVVLIAKHNIVVMFRITTALREFEEIGFLSFGWIGLDSDRQQQDLVSLLNRVLVAVFSYVPIAFLRFLTGIRHRRRIDRELEQIKRRVSMLEKGANRSDL